MKNLDESSGIYPWQFVSRLASLSIFHILNVTLSDGTSLECDTTICALPTLHLIESNSFLVPESQPPMI